LRKKLEPAVEAWVDEGKATENDNDALEATWEAAKAFIGPSSAGAAMKIRRDPYTAEERELGVENVNTGLSKPMKMSDDDESQGDEEGPEKDNENDTKKLGEAPARTLDDIVRFMTTGLTPEDDSQLSAGMFFRK
jgi:mediator of RNA polymerase II transcription subunit 8